MKQIHCKKFHHRISPRRQKQAFGRIIALLPAILLLTGCASEEKTLLLPQPQSAEEESESAGPAKDFSVKKIYAYTYETRDMLMKSAFLQDCGENEIRIAALEEKDADEKLISRKVDYRYGFYDTEGEYILFQEDWFAPEDGVQKEDLYVDQLLPSPDGTQMLVYVRSAFWDTCFVWLSTLGEPKPLLLYEGLAQSSYQLQGSFSPDGHWFTFDMVGTVMKDKYLVPVYACGKREPAEDEEYWLLWTKGEHSSRLCPPDLLLYADIDEDAFLWATTLCEVSDAGLPGLLSFTMDSHDKLSLQVEYRFEDESATDTAGDGNADTEQDKNPKQDIPEKDPAPGTQSDASAMPSAENPSDAGRRLFLLEIDAEENTAPENEESPGINSQTQLSEEAFRMQGHISAYLDGYTGMPFFQYKLKGNRLYYMDDSDQLFQLDFQTPENQGWSLSFPAPVWDFLPLETGDILAVLTTVPASIQSESHTDNVNGSYGNYDGFSPYKLQYYWDIQSADLYLYPADGSERILLYKNVQNLLNMEYDAQTRRILLETYEDDSLSHRRCIILEL